MKRSKHSLSNYKLLTCDMGELVPVGVYEVLPGDSVQQATSALIRVSPLLAPVMHPVSVRIHHWFVPNRLIWEDWEDFITGGPDGADVSVFPTITDTVGDGDLHDYFGVPPQGFNVEFSALPARAYALIYNEFYRDQDLVTPVVMSKASGPDTTTSKLVLKVAWEKDYFTAARPWPQKGPDITLPLGTTAPVVTNNAAIKVRGTVENIDRGLTGLSTTSPPYGVFTSGAWTGSESLKFGSESGLQTDLSGASAVDVNTVRRAFALQRYQEARAAYGSRYTEYLRYLGVRSSDSRLQRPEYLGGGKQTISFSEILQTAEGAEPVGTMKGHGIAAMRTRRFRRFFEEHGQVITLMSVRPRTMYANGMPRMWNRRTKEDFWQKELEKIGQQEVYRREIYSEAGAPGDTVFGYADRYSEYRHIQSTIAGDFRTGVMDHWHMARMLTGAPTLNKAFIECEPTKRIHAVETADVLWVMANNNIQARRMVSNNVIGRIT